MEIKNLLPIGTVVELEDSEKKLMIVGIKPNDQNEGIIHDYIGVFYPEGYIRRELFFVFDHEDISNVVFEGYTSQEYKDFLENVAKAIEK